MGNAGGKGKSSSGKDDGIIKSGHSGLRSNLVQGRKLDSSKSLWEIYEKGKILGHGELGRGACPRGLVASRLPAERAQG